MYRKRVSFFPNLEHTALLLIGKNSYLFFQLASLGSSCLVNEQVMSYTEQIFIEHFLCVRHYVWWCWQCSYEKGH